LQGRSAVVAPPKTPTPLRPIFQAYAKQAQLAPSTVKRRSPVVDRLTEHLGHDDAAARTRADIVAWKDPLLESDMSNVSVRDVYTITAICRIATCHGFQRPFYRACSALRGAAAGTVERPYHHSVVFDKSAKHRANKLAAPGVFRDGPPVPMQKIILPTSTKVQMRT
jgi:hypothetical protein